MESLIPQGMKIFALIAFSATAFAGKPIVITEPEPRGYFQIDGAYGAEADYAGGSSSVWSGRAQLGFIRPITGIGLLANRDGQWQLRLGLDHERFEFSGLALPSRLQRVSAVIALEYRIGRQIGILLEARPGVHFENSIRSNAWNCPVLFGIGIPVTERFAVALAGRYDAFAENPFIGGPGFVWKISDRLTLDAVPPEPRLRWAASEVLSLWLGGEVAGGAFRTESNALVDYSDYRASIGATLRQGAWLMEAGAGVSFEREWAFHRIGTTVSTDEPAPFFKLAVRTEW